MILPNATNTKIRKIWAGRFVVLQTALLKKRITGYRYSYQLILQLSCINNVLTTK